MKKIKMLKISLYLKLLLLFSDFDYGKSILIKTKQGYLRGQTEKSRAGRQFYAFYGIPFAEPPIGELRLEDPVPAKNWKGTLDATKLPPQCLNHSNTSVLGQEDCLYLNIYTPKIDKQKLLPVIVFVYGSTFMYGHALPNRYGPHYFMDKDVIVITFHYRLGPLGFLSTGDEVMPGNYGLKDFAEVLRWVQKNIESFGGDKDRVTVAGGSSGGMTAALAMVSPLTKGLFHRCISQSGMPGNVADPEKQRRMALKFVSFTSCHHENVSTSRQIKSCLKKLPAQEIGENIEKVFELGSLLPLMPYGPSIENEKVPGAFLIDQPSKLLSGNINIPWILGMNSGEGGMEAIFMYLTTMTTYRAAHKLEENYLKYFPELFGYGGANSDFVSLRKKTEDIVKQYYGDTKISENYQAFAQAITDTFSAIFRKTLNAYRGIKYAYYYDHRNEQSFDKYNGNPLDIDLGVLHGDELISMFNWSEALKPVTKGIDLVVSEQMLEFWVNFATFGDPNGLGEKIWTPMNTTNLTYLHIKNGMLKMEHELMESQNKFWNDIWS